MRYMYISELPHSPCEVHYPLMKAQKHLRYNGCQHSLNFTGTHHPKLFLPTACDFQNFGVRIRCHINVIALKFEKSLFYSISVFYLPLYSIPSVLLHGEAATSSGIVNGSFFNPSKLFPNAYKLPSFGSGKNAGLKTKHDKNM